jgi:hypothetical protein
MPDSDSGSFPLALLILFISVGVVFGILFLSRTLYDSNAVPEDQDPAALLKGVFSFQPLLDESSFVTTSQNPNNEIQLSYSNNSDIPCNNYSWVYNQTDKTLEWGGNIPNISDSQKLVATARINPDTPILLQPKGTPGPLNQWVYNQNDQTWCLDSDTSLCMESSTTDLRLELLRENDLTFKWLIQPDVTPPNCT